MSDKSAPQAPTKSNADPATRQLLYDELRHRHEIQRAVSDRLEGKAALVIGAVLALVPFVAKEPVRSWWLPVALALYAIAGLSALVVVLPRRFEELSPERCLREVWWWKVSDAAGQLANARLDAIKLNVGHQAYKVRWLRVSIVALLLGAIMSAAHLTTGDREDVGRTGTEAGTAASSCVNAGS